MAGMAVVLRGWLPHSIEERRRWPIITASPRGQRNTSAKCKTMLRFVRPPFTFWVFGAIQVLRNAFFLEIGPQSTPT